MKILEGEELEEARKYIEKAVKVSEKSICRVSKIGTVLVKDGKVIGEGFSGPMGSEKCNPCVLELIENDVKTELCYAMHAGERAVMNALKKGKNTQGAKIYTIKVVGGKLSPYKNGFCASCSRLFMESGVSDIVFPTEEGIISYEAEEFYSCSFDSFVKEKFIL